MGRKGKGWGGQGKKGAEKGETGLGGGVIPPKHCYREQPSNPRGVRRGHCTSLETLVEENNQTNPEVLTNPLEDVCLRIAPRGRVSSHWLVPSFSVLR